MQEIDDAMDLARPLLSQAGFATDTWDAQLLSRREDEVMHRVVVKLSAQDRPPLIVKHIRRPSAPDRFQTTTSRQADVAAQFSGAPTIHAFDPQNQILLMDCVKGRTLYDLFTDSPVEDHDVVLEAAGRWVNQFHRSLPCEHRQFHPSRTVQWLSALADKVQSGEKQVPQKKRFLAFFRSTLRTVPTPDQCATIAATAHGDMNMGNILVHPDGAAGIDFGKSDIRPVGYDLAQLFCHYAAICVNPRSDGATAPLPGVDLSAFFRGYDLVSQDDGSVAFLCRVRLLRDWANVPKNSDDRSLAQQIRFRGIQRLVQRGFG